MIDTIDYFIEYCEGELEGLAWEIQEETNFEDNAIDFLSEHYDTVEQRLKDLEQIKTILNQQ